MPTKDYNPDKKVNIFKSIKMFLQKSYFLKIHFLRGLSNAKTILVEQLCYYLSYNWRDKRDHAFPKSIIPTVKVTA